MWEYGLKLENCSHFTELYNWKVSEENFESFTCRPLSGLITYDDYVKKMTLMLRDKSKRFYVLTENNSSKALGKIELFDYNSRNHSAEFGYYFPRDNRGKGLGSIILQQFMNIIFKDEQFDLNKLYATTSSNNIPSIKLLEKFGFKLDGRMREHYWIGENRYDQLIYSILKSEWYAKTDED